MLRMQFKPKALPWARVSPPLWGFPESAIGNRHSTFDSTIRVHNSRSERLFSGDNLWGLGNPPNVLNSGTLCRTWEVHRQFPASSFRAEHLERRVIEDSAGS